MFHKVKEVAALPDMHLSVLFTDGTTKSYDVGALVGKYPAFKKLKNERLFNEVSVDTGGYGIIWDDDVDLSSDELWEHGSVVATPFDGLMSFSDASDTWGLSDSTLRKAVSCGRMTPGVDVRKFGKQWVVTRDAMEREYGRPA